MNLKSMTLPELSALLKEMGQPAFRAKQLYGWLHRGVRSYEEMTNLPGALRAALAEKYPIHAPTVVRRQESQKDGTIKYLWQLSDGNCVETVLMRYHYGNTVCISTEVGCRMGCAFCASTIGGLVRKDGDGGRRRRSGDASSHDEVGRNAARAGGRLLISDVQSSMSLMNAWSSSRHLTFRRR